MPEPWYQNRRYTVSIKDGPHFRTREITRASDSERFRWYEEAVKAPPASSVNVGSEFRAICDIALKALSATPLNPVPAEPSELAELVFAVQLSTSRGGAGDPVESWLTMSVFWPSQIYVAMGDWGWVTESFSAVSGAPVLRDDAGRMCSYSASDWLWSTDPADLVGVLAKSLDWYMGGEQHGVARVSGWVTGSTTDTEFMFPPRKRALPAPTAPQRPTPRLIRSASDAEAVAATWLEWMGFTGARVTQAGADLGRDVVAPGLVVQVKAEAARTGRPVIQQTFGVARAEDAEAAVFSLAGFTKEAIGWGTANGVALFEFDLQGEPSPANGVAREWLESPAASSELGGSPGSIFGFEDLPPDWEPIWPPTGWATFPGLAALPLGLVGATDDLISIIAHSWESSLDENPDVASQLGATYEGAISGLALGLRYTHLLGLWAMNSAGDFEDLSVLETLSQARFRLLHEAEVSRELLSRLRDNVAAAAQAFTLIPVLAQSSQITQWEIAVAAERFVEQLLSASGLAEARAREVAGTFREQAATRFESGGIEPWTGAGVIVPPAWGPFADLAVKWGPSGPLASALQPALAVWETTRADGADECSEMAVTLVDGFPKLLVGMIAGVIAQAPEDSSSWAMFHDVAPLFGLDRPACWSPRLLRRIAHREYSETTLEAIVVAWQNGLVSQAQATVTSILAALDVITELTQSEDVARATKDDRNRAKLARTIVYQATDLT